MKQHDYIEQLVENQRFLRSAFAVLNREPQRASHGFMRHPPHGILGHIAERRHFLRPCFDIVSDAPDCRGPWPEAAL